VKYKRTIGVGDRIKIIATTGFKHIYSRSEMLQLFTDTLKTVTKTIELRMSRLRSASEIFKKGGHVTMEYRDQQFRLHFIKNTQHTKGF